MALFVDHLNICIVKVLRIIEKDGLARGLYLSGSKSLSFLPEEDNFSLNPLLSDIPLTREGIVFAGCPIYWFSLLLCFHFT